MVDTVRVPQERLQGCRVLYRVQLDGVIPAAAEKQIPPLHVPAQAAALLAQEQQQDGCRHHMVWDESLLRLLVCVCMHA